MFSALSESYTKYFGPKYAAAGMFDQPLLGYPTAVLLICAFYLLLILKIGPDFMKNRIAFDLKKVLLIYNSMQIFLNFLVCFYSVKLHLYYHAYTFHNWQILSNEHPQKYIEVWTSYLFFLLKILDLCDTIFFVLRKSFRQVSFLHVYHHLAVVTWAYMALHFYGAGERFYHFTKVLNGFIHCVMYGYYLMSAQLPQYRTTLKKFKKYITRLQMTQLAVGICHVSYIVRRDYSKGYDLYCWYLIAQLSVLIYLFGIFYVKSYILSPKHKNSSKEKDF